ncbi:MAG: hypothetical protein HYZ89_04025 [Candidatus Omnitrophica bacterium]|nr:hypothetical protein [Candidatus Omnitrophota bacterium]
MANEIRRKFDAKANVTLTAASLANGSARQSTMLANSTNRPAAMVYIKLKSGATAPTAGQTYDVYLLRGDDAASSGYRSDGAGASDAAITIENAQLLGTIVMTATANKNFYGEFDTAPLGPLGPEWGIAIKNNSGQALSSTEADHVKESAYYVDEIQ